MLYFLWLKKPLTVIALVIGVIVSSVVVGLTTSTPTLAQGAAPSTGPCYSYVGNYTIEYTNPTCQVSAVMDTYISTDGGITFKGDPITYSNGGYGSQAKPCDPGTNEIKIVDGAAVLTIQDLERANRGTKCGEIVTKKINLVDWNGETEIDSAVNAAEANALYAQFGNSLDDVKTQWVGYKCPTGTGGSVIIDGYSCGDAGWKAIIYECWSTVVQRELSSGDEETAKSNFSTCVSEKARGVNIIALKTSIKEMSFTEIQAAVDQAGDTAAGEVIAESQEGNDEEEELVASSCGIEGIGWIVCPLLTFMSSLADTTLSFLSSTFLETDVSYIQDDSVTQAWSVMRNIANVAFVIAFLIIIFSQLTGGGMSNYGVKKMLPRLVIAAILVNVSLFICLLAIDISNILGYSIAGLFDTVWNNINVEAPDGRIDATGNGWGIAAIIGGVLAGGITLIFSLSVPVILAAIVALMMIVLILFARIALIFLLTIISPLAFVAFLLPNTEEWFKKWYKMYFALLMVFPVIAVVFGASSLAAGILNKVAQEAGGDEMLQIVAVGVAAIPLFIVPSLLKGSLSAAGTIGTKLSNMSSKLNGRVGGKVKDTSKLGAYNSAYKRSQQIKRAQITGGVYKGRNPLSRLSSNINSRINQSKLTGTMGTQVAQQAASMANKLQAENIEAAHAQIQQANMSTANLKAIADGGSANGINGKDNATRAAAMIQLKRAGKFDELASSWDTAMSAPRSRENDETRRVVAQAFANSADRPGFMGQGVLADVARSENLQGKTLGELAAANGSKYSAEKLALTDHSELEYVIHQQVNINGGIQPELQYAAQKALGTNEIDSKITNNRGDIDQLAGNAPLPPPTP